MTTAPDVTSTESSRRTVSAGISQSLAAAAPPETMPLTGGLVAVLLPRTGPALRRPSARPRPPFSAEDRVQLRSEAALRARGRAAEARREMARRIPTHRPGDGA